MLYVGLDLSRKRLAGQALLPDDERVASGCPGIGWALAFTIASEIGDITWFPSPRKLVGYAGLCPRVDQSGERDRRGPLRKCRA